MRLVMILLLASVALLGCGHSATQYRPEVRQGMTWDRAVRVIEQGFYEDYGKERPEAVQVTSEAIVLADGTVTTARHAGTAVPVYGAAVLVGSSQARTIAAGQRIYLSSLEPSIVLKRNGRDNRYAVILRSSPGVTARRVFFRNEQRAQEFADAIELVRRAPGEAVSVPSGVASESGSLTKEQYKQQQIKRLMEESPPYEEYSRRMREIQAQ